MKGGRGVGGSMGEMKRIKEGGGNRKGGQKESGREGGKEGKEKQVT